MKISKNYIKSISLCFIILAILIFTWILFVNPKLGVADQGDFDRVMNAVGLSLLDSDTNNPDFVRFYKYIITELEDTNILQNLDVYILCTCAIAIDRLITIESIINKNQNAIMNKDLMSSKDKYTKDLYRCCNELSLSPQSRAKLGSLALANKEKKEDSLINILQGKDDEE